MLETTNYQPCCEKNCKFLPFSIKLRIYHDLSIFIRYIPHINHSCWGFVAALSMQRASVCSVSGIPSIPAICTRCCRLLPVQAIIKAVHWGLINQQQPLITTYSIGGLWGLINHLITIYTTSRPLGKTTSPNAASSCRHSPLF